MGSYGGHILPGTFFIIFGIWFTIKYAYQYLKSRSRKSYYTQFLCCGKLPCSVIVAEACVKIFFTSVGILVELFYPGAPMGRLHADNGHFTGPMNWQHTTMYFFFLLTGVFDIVCYTGRKVVPIGLDRFFGGVALFVEGYLFYFHLHGRSLIDTRVHILLVIAVWPGALIAFIETFVATKRTTLHILEMLHSMLLIFQGLWFWQAAYILYPPNGEKWDPCFTEMDMDMSNHSDEGGHSHDDAPSMAKCDEKLEHLNINFITMFWTWHLALCMLFTLAVYTVIYKYLKARGQLDPTFMDGYISVSRNNKSQNGRLLAEDGL